MEAEVRVTTNPDYYEEHAENVEFWSPGNPLFHAAMSVPSVAETGEAKSLKEILERP